MAGEVTMSDNKSAFEEGAAEERISLATEFLYFLRDNKKWWLLPIIIVLSLIGAIAFIASGSGVAPFIYTVF